jgi:hypothetical protein
MWIDILRREVNAKGPKQVAKELGISRSAVDLVCQGKYAASTAKIEARVKKIYGNNGGGIDCPVLGSITPNVCSDKWTLAKKIGMKAGNPDTLRLYKTCSNCSVRK